VPPIRYRIARWLPDFRRLALSLRSIMRFVEGYRNVVSGDAAVQP
jgi:hypothetical protein